MPLDFVRQSRQKSIDGMKAAFRRAGGPGTIQRLLEEEMAYDKNYSFSGGQVG